MPDCQCCHLWHALKFQIVSWSLFVDRSFEFIEIENLVVEYKNVCESLKENWNTTMDVSRSRNHISEDGIQIECFLSGVAIFNIRRSGKRVEW